MQCDNQSSEWSRSAIKYWHQEARCLHPSDSLGHVGILWPSFGGKRTRTMVMASEGHDASRFLLLEDQEVGPVTSSAELLGEKERHGIRG